MSRVRVCCSVALVLTVALAAAPGRTAEIPKPTHIAADRATCDAASIAGTLQSFAVPRRASGKQRELLAVIAESPPPATGSSPSTAPPPSCHATNASLASSKVPASTLKLVRLVTSDPPQLETLTPNSPPIRPVLLPSMSMVMASMSCSLRRAMVCKCCIRATTVLGANRSFRGSRIRR